MSVPLVGLLVRKVRAVLFRFGHPGAACSMSVLLRAFLQRRAPLLIIETQKSPWNVSDRFVSRKNNEVTAWIMRNLFFSAFSRSKSVSQVFFHCPSMDRFVSKRSSSSVDLDSSSRNDVRAERAAIALSVCLSEFATRQVHEADARSAQLAAALGTSSSGAHPRPPRASTWCPLAAPGLVDRLAAHTHEELAHTKTPRATPAAALVEDEPSGSGSERRKVHVDPIARDWFLDMMDQWKTERRWSMHRCSADVRRLCPRMFDGINPNTPNRWKRSTPRAERDAWQENFALARRHDTAERAHHAGHRRAVPQCGDDQRPGARMARRRGARRASRRYPRSPPSA